MRGMSLEVDITKKVNHFLKWGLVAVFLMTILSVGGIWFYQRSHSYVTIDDAKVMSALVSVKTRADGTVAEILVENGAHVNAGDLIARIKVNVTDEDLQQLQQNVDLAKRSLAELQKGIPVTQAIPGAGSGDASSAPDVAQAKARLDRMNELYAMGAISAVKREQAEAEYNAAVAGSQSRPTGNVGYQTIIQPASPEQIKQAELLLKQAEIALAKAQKAKESTEIRAPVSGTVYLSSEISLERAVNDGQVVANVGNADNLWIEAYIEPTLKDKVRLGQFASYQTNGHDIQGTVQDIIDPQETEEQKEETKDTDGTGQKILVRISVPKDIGEDLKPDTKLVVRLSP